MVWSHIIRNNVEYIFAYVLISSVVCLCIYTSQLSQKVDRTETKEKKTFTRN